MMPSFFFVLTLYTYFMEEDNTQKINLEQFLDKDYHLNYNYILSKNKDVNFITGARSIGKTYGWKRWAIKRFIKYGERFMYIRRTASEVEEQENTFFDKMAERDEFKDVKFGVIKKYGVLTINGQQAGKLEYLSGLQIQNAKGVDAPGFINFVYDEFLPEVGVHYEYDEPYRVMNLLHSYIRDNEKYRLFLLSNYADPFSPYYKYFGVAAPKVSNTYRIYRGAKSCFICLLRLPDRVLSDDNKQTAFDRWAKTTSYYDYAYKNQDIHKDERAILKEVPTNPEPVCTIEVASGERYGLWLNSVGDFIFLKKKSPQIFVASKKGRKGAPSIKTSPIFSALLLSAQRGRIFYETTRMRDVVEDEVLSL